jgi:methionine synthase I (cobalamin-dependent)
VVRKQPFPPSVRLQTGSRHVDFFIAETFHYLGEALLALQAFQEAGLPAMMTFNFKQPPTSRDVSPAECACDLEGAGANLVGTNCGRDPVRMLPLAEEIRKAVGCRVAIQAAAAAQSRFHISWAGPNSRSHLIRSS